MTSWQPPYARTRSTPQLYDALLMKKRHQLGLPLEGAETLRDLPEKQQTELEEYYIEICREVGQLFLEEGDISGAWPYFRAIDEPKAVADALESWEPEDSGDDYDEELEARNEAIIDLALNQGAHPRRGFELVLEKYGVCRAITTYEHQFPHEAEVKAECASILVERLYNDLLEGIQYDVKSRDDGVLPEGADIRGLMQANRWLLEEHGYHVDMSHLQSVIRASIRLTSKKELDLALQMAEYGRHLPRDYQNPDLPPFDDFYTDYRIFLQALVGTGIDGAIRYFTQKVDNADPDEIGQHLPGEVLVYLLYRVGRYDEAIDAHRKYLSESFRTHVVAPLAHGAQRKIWQLRQAAGDGERTRRSAPLRRRLGEELSEDTVAPAPRAGGPRENCAAIEFIASAEDIVNHVSVHIREAENPAVVAVGELLVIESKEMENRRM